MADVTNPKDNTHNFPSASPNRSLLVIDDDEKLIALLQSYLANHQLKVTGAPTGAIGLGLFAKVQPELVILDVMLPGQTGFEILKDLRKISDVPVIMLTARGEVTDRIVGLELGADDYLAKPFEPRELLARIETVLRRGRPTASSHRLIFGELVIDRNDRSAKLADRDLELTTLEWDILHLLASQPQKALSRDQIAAQLHGHEWDAFDRSIDVLVSRVRQRLGDHPKQPTYIKTIWGSGYMFIARPGFQAEDP